MLSIQHYYHNKQEKVQGSSSPNQTTSYLFKDRDFHQCFESVWTEINGLAREGLRVSRDDEFGSPSNETPIRIVVGQDESTFDPLLERVEKVGARRKNQNLCTATF